MKLPNFQTFFKMPVSRIDKFSKGRVQKKKIMEFSLKGGGGPSDLGPVSLIFFY